MTGFLLLGLCLLAGALGGLVNHYDRKQKGLPASLLTGMIVALRITWLYVWVGLPNVNEGYLASIMHNPVERGDGGHHRRRVRRQRLETRREKSRVQSV